MCVCVCEGKKKLLGSPSPAVLKDCYADLIPSLDGGVKSKQSGIRRRAATPARLGKGYGI